MLLSSLTETETHLIGSGGFSSVYKKKNKLDGVTYAIKKISLDPEEIDSILSVLSEVRILARLNHLNIIRYHHTWVQETQDAEKPYECCIQMELCDFSLSTFLKERQSICRNQSMDLFRQILNGVEYLHRNDIIHRDLKPDNILCKMSEGNLVAKISDFGLSRFKSRRQPLIKTLSQDSGESGTELYMSTRRTCDATEVDIYSLGIVLFELYSSFFTEMERIITLRKLRQTHIPPAYFEHDYPNISLLVRNMLSELCPTAKTLQRVTSTTDDPHIMCRDITWDIICRAMLSIRDGTSTR